MGHFLRSLAVFFYTLGGPGLLLLGVLDSSFLFLPLGNDLLIVALTAAHHDRMFWYVAMATLGSAAGVEFTRWVSAKGGEKGLEATHKTRQIAYVEKKVKERGGVALAVASLMPPPFPFTPFIIVAAALQYPRKRMLTIIAACRALRFTIDGVLALIFGRQIIRLARSPRFETFIIVLVIVSMAGSAFSIYGWIRKSRTRH